MLINKRFPLFLENALIRFFPFFVSRKTHKILTQLHYFHVILTERSPINIDFAL